MGKRGTKPVPTHLKIVHGVRPSRINADTPTPPATPNAGRVPTHLSIEAKKVWRTYVKAGLVSKDLLTEWDRDAFCVFCEAVVHHREACRLMAAGMLVKGARGGLVKNPAAQVVRDNAAVIRAFAGEFGLTPSARSGISLPNDTADELAGILSGTR